MGVKQRISQDGPVGRGSSANLPASSEVWPKSPRSALNSGFNADNSGFAEANGGSHVAAFAQRRQHPISGPESRCLEVTVMSQYKNGNSLVRPARLLRSDLCAQLTPINRYGPTGLSTALVDGLRALFGAAGRARAEGCHAHC
jgi:hypothetical protein